MSTATARWRMSRCRNRRCVLLAPVVLAVCTAGVAIAAETPGPTAPPAKRLGIGRQATAQEIAGWSIGIRPDGQGLPPGRGTVRQGEPLYLRYCAGCHGEFGESAGRWPILMGGAGTLAGDNPVKSIGSY